MATVQGQAASACYTESAATASIGGGPQMIILSPDPHAAFADQDTNAGVFEAVPPSYVMAPGLIDGIYDS